MARSKSRAIVIDASIARAAGPENAVHPTAKTCRAFLINVREICHRAAFSAELSEEWTRHRSGFARTWQVSMFARKKIVRVPTDADPTIRQLVESRTADDEALEAMLKDTHLIEAALAADGPIASLDETARAYFQEAAKAIPAIRPVCWVNPCLSEDGGVTWLQGGAQPDEILCLGTPPTYSAKELS